MAGITDLLGAMCVQGLIHGSGSMNCWSVSLSDLGRT